MSDTNEDPTKVGEPTADELRDLAREADTGELILDPPALDLVELADAEPTAERELTSEEIAQKRQAEIDRQERERKELIAGMANRILEDNAAVAATLGPWWVTASGLIWDSADTVNPDVNRPGSETRLRALRAQVDAISAGPKDHMSNALKAIAVMNLQAAEQEPPETEDQAWLRLTGQAKPEPGEVIETWQGDGATYRLYPALSDGRGRISIEFPDGRSGISLINS